MGWFSNAIDVAKKTAPSLEAGAYEKEAAKIWDDSVKRKKEAEKLEREAEVARRKAGSQRPGPDTNPFIGPEVARLRARIASLDAEMLRLVAGNRSQVAIMLRERAARNKYKSLAAAESDPAKRREYLAQADVHHGRAQELLLVNLTIQEAHKHCEKEKKQLEARIRTLESWKG